MQTYWPHTRKCNKLSYTREDLRSKDFKYNFWELYKLFHGQFFILCQNCQHSHFQSFYKLFLFQSFYQLLDYFVLSGKSYPTAIANYKQAWCRRVGQQIIYFQHSVETNLKRSVHLFDIDVQSGNFNRHNFKL